jgi:subtilase family serine protease
MKPYFHRAQPNDAATFSPLDLIQIYNLPPLQVPNVRPKVVVVSFGGGLYGTLHPDGTITNGDVQGYWSRLGMTDMPKVNIQLLGGAQNNPADDSTVENTIDVEMIGAIMPHCDITLIIAPNSGNTFVQVLQAALALKPLVVSCSWGFPEHGTPKNFIQDIDNVLQALSAANINVCCAAGDRGSNDGTSSPSADFPGSSPHVTCCGGTRLVCPDKDVYDSKTQETVWNDDPTSSATGGGVSSIFPKPSYQSNIPGTNRMVPDITGVGDPFTGVNFLINGQFQPIGGTSIVAPFVSGFLARIGCNRFINPLLYSAPATCFHDIVSGGNGAYQAGKGFDLCSGLGSINGLSLAPYLTNDQPTQTGSIVPSSLTFTLLTAQQLQFQLPNGVWNTSDTEVATVNTTGLVTPVANGSCIISNTLATNRCHVVVNLDAGNVLVTHIALIPAIAVGQTISLASALSPANATNHDISFVSSDPNIARLDQGLVTGVSPGSVHITATSNDAGHTSASINLIVYLVGH